MTASRCLSPVILLLILVCLLCGCGQAADTSGLSGSYVLSGASDGSIVLSDGAVADLPLKLRLDPGGGGIVSNGETVGSLRWTVHDGYVTVEIGEAVLGGTTEGTDLLLQAAGSDTRLRFISVPATDEKPVSTDSADNPDEEVDFDSDAEPYCWYGWWSIDDSDGSFPTSWYDCCARLDPQADDTWVLTVWDEDSSRDEPLASICFQKAEDGSLTSLNGYWLYDDIVSGEWVLPAPGDVLRLDDLEHDAAGTVFRYRIYLRSWGDRWRDCPAEQLPFYFEDWYLPLVRKGAAMPDSIPWESLEKTREKLP